jgi:phenylacetate-CoA ligase
VAVEGTGLGAADEVLYFDRAVETAPAEATRERQLLRWTELSRLLWDRNPFYRKKWRDAGLSHPGEVRTWDDFARLPFTRKDELVTDQEANPPFGTNLTFPLDRYVRLHQTSGTTGRPLRWLDTAESWDWWVRCWGFVLAAAGVRPGDRVFFAFSFGPFIGFWSAFAAAERYGALPIPGGGQDSLTRLRTILDLGATVLLCTPSYALRLAEVAGEHGLPIQRGPVRITIHAGEPGASIPATKRAIEAAWGARCYDHTGMTEMGAIGYECSAQAGVHVNESEFIAEVIDPATGRPVDEGGEGELVLTNLGRAGSPLVRYRTGDRVRLTRARCACGRTFARLDGGILGRVDDMFHVRGVNVFPSAIENIIRARPDVVEFQIQLRRVRGLDELGVLVELADGHPSPEAVARDIARDIQVNLQLRAEVRAVPRHSLPRFEGKARRVVRLGEAG